MYLYIVSYCCAIITICIIIVGDNVNAYMDKPPLDQPTVRNTNCSIIVEGSDRRCTACTRHRSSLRAIYSQKDLTPVASKVDPKSHINY